MSEFKYINTDRKVKLEKLILSNDIDNKSVIQIIDPDGSMIACGPWYEDKILDLGDERGVARMSEAHTVKFQILRGGKT